MDFLADLPVLPSERELENLLAQASVSENRTKSEFQLIGRQFLVGTSRSTLPKGSIGQVTPVILDTAGFDDENSKSPVEKMQSEQLEVARLPESPTQGIFIAGPGNAADHLARAWSRSFENVG